MNTIKKEIEQLSARKIRNYGFGFFLGSVAFAAFIPYWQINVIVALFVCGIGVGLGDWERGD